MGADEQPVGVQPALADHLAAMTGDAGANDPSAIEEALAEALANDVVLHAEQFAHGRRCLRIVHGPLADARDQTILAHVRQLAPTAAVRIGGREEQFITASGTRDETVIWWSSWGGVSADDVVDDFADRAAGLSPRTWRFSTNPNA